MTPNQSRLCHFVKLSTIFPFVGKIGYITGVIGTHPMETISGFEMLLSLHFGMYFWLNEYDDFCYCPAFEDSTADHDNWGFVSEWDDMSDVDLDKLFTIHRHLVVDKVTQEYENMPA